MSLYEVESMMRSLSKLDKPPEALPDMEALKDKWRSHGFKDVKL